VIYLPLEKLLAPVVPVGDVPPPAGAGSSAPPPPDINQMKQDIDALKNSANRRREPRP